jgi:hypothetical protein
LPACALLPKNHPAIDFAASFDSLEIMEKSHAAFLPPRFDRERMGSQTDWNGVDSLMLKALGAAEKVARYRHAQLSAVKIAGDINARVADNASLDELLERIKDELNKLGPILDMEIVREPTEGGVAAGVERSSTALAQTFERGRRPAS